ncbi:MAG: hypothetical protein WBO36_13495 [Saprospiraceae bacterium]
MESTFIIKKEELNQNFIDNILSLYQDARLIQITVNQREDFGLYQKETAEDYMTRLENAASDIEKGHKIEFSSEQFESLIKGSE